MVNKFGRAFDHLTKTSSLESILDAIQAVEDLFSEEWLKRKESHRLQLLWNRKDYLSTNELFSFGKAINRLKKHNSTWLESTANEIKKNIHTSHGLITEIIIAGSLSTEKGVVRPCPKSYPIYDYTIDFDSGYKYKVSVKNFDISDHEKLFKQRCDLIRQTFKNYVKHHKKSGSLYIVCSNGILTKEITDQICFFIVFEMDGYQQYFLNKLGVIINFQKIAFFDKYRLQHSSDIVMILGNQHYNEQRNIESKIKLANNSLLKDPTDNSSIKKLIIRLGETTNIKKIKKYVEHIARDYENCGFDICILIQPTVCSNLENNSTQIINSMFFIPREYALLSDNLPEKLENTGLVTMDLGVGSVSFEEAPLKLMNGDIPTDLDLSNFYVYQQGDVYLKMQKEGDVYSGEFIQSFPGVKSHLIFKNFTFIPMIFDNTNKLLIV